MFSDDDGMDTDDLERVLAAEPTAKMIYVVPDFANPTGTTLSLPRRRRLVELANEHDVLVVEDTPYRPLRYSGDHLPTLKSLDTEGRVLHLGSFSKILAPGMRLGWAVAESGDSGAAELAQTCRRHAEQHAQHGGNLGISGSLRPRRTYRSIGAGLPAQAGPDAAHHGGDFPRRRQLDRAGWRAVHLADVSRGFDAAAFMAERLLPEAKVAFVPGATFFPVQQQPQHARMSFSGVPDDRLVRGVTAIGTLLRQV